MVISILEGRAWVFGYCGFTWTGPDPGSTRSGMAIPEPVFVKALTKGKYLNKLYQFVFYLRKLLKRRGMPGIVMVPVKLPNALTHKHTNTSKNKD